MPTLGDTADSAYDPWAVQQRIGLTDARLALDSVLMPVSGLSYIDYRSGVMASGDNEGSGGNTTHMAMRVQPVDGGGLQVTVEMGNVVINTPTQGAYMGALDSRKTLDLAASSATTNREDLVIARIHDDLNSAIASTSGERKLRVEVWTGDPATGEPTRAEPTPTEGWWPLAAVRVNKNATTITSADITDLRGRAMTARGGMPALYGADAKVDSDEFATPGAYAGEQRWVHGNPFPHQVYWGGNPDEEQNGWKGVHNCVVYTQRPEPRGTWWVKGPGQIGQICQLTIPYPGTPFVIYPSARANYTLSYNVVAELRISMNSMTGELVNFQGCSSWGTTSDSPMALSVPPIMYGPFTSSVTLSLNCLVRRAPSNNHGAAWNSNDVGQHLLSVPIYPATISPQKVWR